MQGHGKWRELDTVAGGGEGSTGKPQTAGSLRSRVLLGRLLWKVTLCLLPIKRVQSTQNEGKQQQSAYQRALQSQGTRLKSANFRQTENT